MAQYKTILETLKKAVEKDSDQSKAFEELQYEGFDPMAMATLLESKAKAAKLNLAKEMTYLICLVILRGTNLSKAVKKMPASGKERVQKLQIAFTIADSAKNQGKDTVSLSRIVATFPQIAAMIISKNPGCNSRLQSLNEDLPEYLCFPGANALIPVEGELSEMHEEYIKFAEGFSKLVESKQTDTERMKFLTITANSRVTGADADRRNFLSMLS